MNSNGDKAILWVTTIITVILAVYFAVHVEMACKSGKWGNAVQEREWVEVETNGKAWLSPELTRKMIDEVAGRYQVEVIGYRFPDRLKLMIPEWMASGTDASCHTFGRMIWQMMMVDDRLRIHVESPTGWVPTAKEPIDYRWAKELRP